STANGLRPSLPPHSPSNKNFQVTFGVPRLLQIRHQHRVYSGRELPRSAAAFSEGTSGSKGFHIVVPLDGKANMEEVEGFAHGAGQFLVRRYPENLTQEFHKVDRGRRILVDTGRNGRSATHAAA